MVLSYKFRAETIVEEGRIRKDKIQEIKEWISTTSVPEIPSEMIILFLLSCENDIENTKNTILSYFKLKSEGHEIFVGRDIKSEELRKNMDVITLSSLPKRMPNNTVIHFFKLKDTNYKNFDLVAGMKLAFMLLDISHRKNPPNEMVVIIDMKGTTFMHLTTFKYGAVKKFLEFLQEAMPMKIQLIHILNANYIFDRCIALGRVFIKNELMSKIIPHSPKMRMEEFYNYVPASCLPREYGGELPSCEELNRMTLEEFEELGGFYEAEEALVRSFRK